jgi:dihydroorotase
MIINNLTVPEFVFEPSLGEQLKTVSIKIENGKIADISKTPLHGNDEVIDGTGLTLLPGLIDPQVHLREPGFEYKEDLESGAKAAAKGGFTQIICMPNTFPIIDTKEWVEFIIQKSQKLNLIDIYPTAAVTIGLMGEKLPDYQSLKNAGAIAFTDDGRGVQDDQKMSEAMALIAHTGLPILDHSEDESLSLKGVIHAGEKASALNLKPINPEAEAVHVQRGCEYAIKTGCHFHALHVSTRRSFEYIRHYKKLTNKVTAEVSPHHLLLSVDDIPVTQGQADAIYKMNPPLRSLDDKIAAVEALLDGTIDFVATDHAPHSEEEKARGFEKAPFGIIGLETAFPLMFTHFVQTQQLTLKRLIELMCYRPAQVFHLPFFKLQVGEKASFTLVNLKKTRKYTKEEIQSKSKNSPFLGYSMAGFSELTVHHGNIVWRQN